MQDSESLSETAAAPGSPLPRTAAVTSAPGHPVRHFVLELATVTAGVFIALSVDSTREWRQHRQLVAEARSTIAREIADNRRELDGTLQTAGARDAQLSEALKLAGEVLAGRPPTVNRLNLGISLSALSRASWQTAERTGALSHMEYAEVQRYSRLYALQDLYDSQQRRALDRLTAAIAIFGQDDPVKAPRADVELFRQQVLALRAELGVLDQFARRLQDSYGEALENKTAGLIR